MNVNVDTTHIVEHANRLAEINRSAYPVSIRGTLNDAVYDVKTRTMPKSAEVFKKRQNNFFKANSKFDKATGFNINSMKATVGFYENKLVHANTNYSVKELEEQEHGGVIEHKAFIAMRPARIGNKMVRANARLAAIKDKIVKTSKVGRGTGGKLISVKSKKQQFIRAAFFAEKKYGKSAFVLGGRSSGGGRTLSLINEIRGSGRYTRNNNLEITRTPLYNVKKGRAISVNPTNFMKRASLETGLQISKFFIAQAEKQFNKLRK
jgi:hypothetical protein